MSHFSHLSRSRTDKQPILLDGFSCKNGDAVSLELAYASIEKLVVREGEIEIEVTAYIRQIPSF